MDVYDEYHKTVNMTAHELNLWRMNHCSLEASLNREPIFRNLHLLKTPKSKWREKEKDWANKTISFVRRMKKVPAGRKIKRCGLSKRTIALKNWAFDPNK